MLPETGVVSLVRMSSFGDHSSFCNHITHPFRNNFFVFLVLVGNKAMQSKIYPEAIELYTFAIALCEDNAVYYCNRSGNFYLDLWSSILYVLNLHFFKCHPHFVICRFVFCWFHEHLPALT